MIKAFSPYINRKLLEFHIIPFQQDDVLDDRKLDILIAKIRLYYSNWLQEKSR